MGRKKSVITSSSSSTSTPNRKASPPNDSASESQIFDSKIPSNGSNNTIRDFLQSYFVIGDRQSQTLTSGSDGGGIQIQASSLESLRKEYVALACANKAFGESKSGSVATSETKDTEIIELEEIRKSYTAVEHKYQTLTALSSELSRRLSETETSAQADLKLERERRLHMSKSFSATINNISAKLDALNKQRESVAVENNDLRLKLKACLDEFDALEAQDKEDTLTHQLQLQSQSDDDLQAIGLLSAQEKALRDVSLQYMQTFTQFQSNARALKARVSNQPVHIEREKLLRATDKYRGCCLQIPVAKSHNHF
eukprot:gene30211-39417_t